jgi:hypothetical protein
MKDQHNKHINVICPSCKRERLVRIYYTIVPNYTGLCRICAASRNNYHFTPHKDGDIGFAHEGYIFVKSKGHPRAYRNGFVKRCVLVMESKLGRPLNRTEHVHHLNEVRDDDRPENLIILTNSEHAKLHAKTRVNIKNRYQMGYSAVKSA